MSHLSRMKNPGLPCPSVAAALRAYGYVLSSLDVRTPWEPLLPLPGHIVLADNRLLYCCFPYLGHPLCAISCLTIAIYAMPPPP